MRVANGDKKTHIAKDLGISRETLYQYLKKIDGSILNKDIQPNNTITV